MLGLRSCPLLLLRGRDGHGLVALLVAKGYESLDVGRGVETVLGEGNRGMRRPLGSTARQDGAPAARRGGAHQRHAGGSEPHPEQAANHIAAGPEHADRKVRAKSTVGLVQRRLGVSQAQAGDAMEMLIQRFDGSRADLTH